MNLLSLKYFIAITEYASFTKAAEHLYVTQPTLSRQIADLEEAFGVKLFTRSKRSISLTEAGRICLEEAREIVSRCDRLVDRLKYAEGDITGSLNVGYLGYIEHAMLSDPLKAFADKYPGLNVGLLQGTLAELNHFLMGNKFDVIYTVATGIETLPGIEYVRIARNDLQLVVPVTHELAQRTSVSVAELANEHFVLFERNVSPLTVDRTIEMCISRGFSPTVTYYVRDAQSMLLMIAAGKGVGFLSSRMASQCPAGVKFLPINDCDVDFDLVVAYKSENENPAILLFVEELRRQKSVFD